jgi:sec-independent protein translocase protein TatA
VEAPVFGLWEFGLLVVILFIVFGARRLPALGEALGRAIAKYRAAASSRDAIVVERRDPALPAAGEGDEERDA